MIFDKKDNITVVTQESVSLIAFVKKLKESYPKLKNDHIILNLFSLQGFSANDILEFLEISNTHRASNKSFIIVTNSVNFDEVPDEIEVVPTLKEAYSLIEIEEIERDLDFSE